MRHEVERIHDMSVHALLSEHRPVATDNQRHPPAPIPEMPRTAVGLSETQRLETMAAQKPVQVNLGTNSEA